MDVQSKKLDFLNIVRKCNKQSEMKNTINEMKNILEGINSGLNDSEENIIV